MSLPSSLLHVAILLPLLGLAAVWIDNMRRLKPGVRAFGRSGVRAFGRSGVQAVAGVGDSDGLPAAGPGLNARTPERLNALPPTVSILIPARDEEANIGACVRSLRAQEYSSLEILVLDDHSTDATARIAAEAAGSDPRVRLLSGAALPAEWTGKAWACHQLAEAARGEWLLFVDADTRHAPAAVGAALGVARDGRRDCLTTWPHLEARTTAERALLPMLLSILFLYLPIRGVEDSPDARFAAANGQFLLFRRDCYRAIGGHAAVRASLLDDVALGRRIKEHGFRLGFFDATALIECRMYRGLGELWQGFSKNLFPGLGGSLPAAALFAAANLLWFVLPPALLLHGLLAGAPLAAIALPATETGVMLAVNLSLVHRFRQAWWFPLIFPLSVLATLALLASSAWRFRTGRGAAWKGRVYHGIADQSAIRDPQSAIERSAVRDPQSKESPQ